MEYYSATKSKEILPFAATWVCLEGIMLSEISQRQMMHDIIYTWRPRENEFVDAENRSVITRDRGQGVSEMGEGGQKI